MTAEVQMAELGPLEATPEWKQRVEMEVQRLEAECKIHEERIQSESEKMLQEQTQGTRGSKLTAEQQRMRQIIAKRRRADKIRARREQTDEEYRLKIQRWEQKGISPTRRIFPKAPNNLTAEEKRIRKVALQRIWNRDKRARAMAEGQVQQERGEIENIQESVEGEIALPRAQQNTNIFETPVPEQEIHQLDRHLEDYGMGHQIQVGIKFESVPVCGIKTQ